MSDRPPREDETRPLPEGEPPADPDPTRPVSQDEIPVFEDDEPETAEALPAIEEITFAPRPPATPGAVPPAPPAEQETDAEPERWEVVRAPAAQRARPPVDARPRALTRKRFATLVAFAETLIPAGGTIEASAIDLDVPQRLDAALGTFDPESRRRLARALTLFEWSSAATRFARPFTRLGPDARAATLARAERSRWRRRRLATQTLKFFCLNQWAATPTVERAIGFTYGCLTREPPREAPALEVISWPQVDRDHTEDCDVVVVGSGAGGSVLAKEMAELGLSVVVLEEGGSHARNDFAGPPLERFVRMYRRQGLLTSAGTPPVALPLGMGIGGSTLVSAGTSMRVPERVLRRWEHDFGIDGIDPDSMRPFFDRVEKLQGVRPVPDEVSGAVAARAREAAAALQISAAPARSMIVGCRGCGTCSFGCPSDAKISTHLSYLPRAQRHGATIYGHARAERVVVEAGRARAIVAALLDPVTRERRAELVVRAKLVVLAAGALHTPLLLGASALGGRSGELGRNLHLHPSASVGAYFDEPVFSWRGHMQPFVIDEWLGSHDVLLAITSSPPSVASGSLSGAGLEVKELVARSPHLATAAVYVADTSTGSVRRGRDGEPRVAYALGRADARRLVRGMVHASEVLLAAGARTVTPGIPGAGTVTDAAELRAIDDERVDLRAFRLTGYHPVGTVRMGRDPEASVVDQWGEVHEVPGLFVADGSALPGSPSVSPQTTIMAFATRTAEHIARHAGRYF